MEVAAAELAGISMRDRDSGSAEIAIALGQDDSRRFADMTGRIVGARLRVSVCGSVVMEPTLQTPIEGGHVVLLAKAQVMTVVFAALESGLCPNRQP